MGVRAEKAAATRGRLLAAARDEFQHHGFAGGRVDRIATSAGVNKRLIYAHFDSKAGLFDAVIADNVARVVLAVPFTPEDMSDYAVRLFDYWTEHPASVRLFAWRNIELAHAPASEDETYHQMIASIEAVGADRTAGLPAAHVLALVFAVLLAWAIPADSLRRPRPEELDRRRRSVAAAVDRLLVDPHDAGQ